MKLKISRRAKIAKSRTEKNELLESYKVIVIQIFLERIKKINKPFTSLTNKRKRFKYIISQLKKDIMTSIIELQMIIKD